jgi:hypothetical protein
MVTIGLTAALSKPSSVEMSNGDRRMEEYEFFYKYVCLYALLKDDYERQIYKSIYIIYDSRQSLWYFIPSCH